MISNKYKLLEQINQGSFGTIFKCINVYTNKTGAIKLEPKNTSKKTIKNEARIYQYLGKLDGFPQLQFFGTTISHHYLVMDLLGPSLTTIILRDQSLSLQTSLFFGIQIIQRIQTLHSKHLLHRDIKPDNFLFTSEQPNKLFLIDFGLSKRYNYDGIHIPETTISTIIGTPNFVSLNNHYGIEPSRRDDLESAIYVILNMLGGALEWTTHDNFNHIIQLKKQIIFKDNVPSFIKTILIYIRNLQFNEKPDYNYIIGILATTCNDNAKSF